MTFSLRKPSLLPQPTQKVHQNDSFQEGLKQLCKEEEEGAQKKVVSRGISLFHEGPFDEGDPRAYFSVYLPKKTIAEQETVEVLAYFAH